MNTATAITKDELFAADAWREIQRRQIAITPTLGLWTASVDECGDSISTKKRKIRLISATSITPLGAVAKLIGLLKDSETAADHNFSLANSREIT